MKKGNSFSGRKYLDNSKLNKSVSYSGSNSSKKKQKINIQKSKIEKKERENLELVTLLIYSLITLIVIESISRYSFVETFSFIIEKPLNAFINFIVIFLVYSVTIFTKRKRFAYFFISISLIVLSSISALLMNFRGMPISPYDILSYKEGIGVASIYLGYRFEFILVAMIVLLIIVLAYIFTSDKNNIWFTGFRNPIIVIVIFSVFSIVVPQLKSSNIINTIAWDVSKSYKINGFTYSFLDETVSSFRKKPKGYSKEKILDIRREVDQQNKKVKFGNVKPNIIVVQLEAFMDPTKLKGVKFNEDPMPNMRRLMNNYTSGFMNVPVTGGGTARTEYEVISGSNFDYLNQGEIPYHTFLSEKPSPSLAQHLRQMGYSTSVVHNFYKDFYNRDKAFANLGFEKFVPLEVMTYVDYTPMGWPKDNVLTKYVMDELNINNKPKFIFTISTQGHSRYPMGELENNYKIKVVKSSLSKADQNQITYYANQVKDMDDFVGELIKEVNKLKNPVVVAFYGDHLPALNVINRNIENVDKFKSIFIVANNFGVPKASIPNDFQGYQLSTLILDTAKLNYGPMNLIHKHMKSNPEYQRNMQLVQYDILFGKNYFLSKNEKPVKIEMKVGNGDMKLYRVEVVNGEYHIRGKNFNRQTEVYMDGKKVDADYKDDTRIKLYDSFYTGEKEIFLRLLDRKNEVIQETEKIKYDF